MYTSDQILAGLQSPDWDERLHAIHALAELKDPQLIPALVNVMVQLAELTEELIDSEEVDEASVRAIRAINESARLPLEKLRDGINQNSLTRSAAIYFLDELDGWQKLLKSGDA